MAANLFGMPYWDALIAETLLENNFSRIYTENVEDFKRITELEVINPLEQGG